MIPTSIDGTDITGATIDGQDVQEITVDGDTVFTAVPPIPQSAIAQYNALELTLNDQDPVSTWPDEVGTLDATGSNPTYISNGINGKPSVRFNGDLLTTNIQTFSQPLVVIMVLQLNDNGGSQRIFNNAAGPDVAIDARFNVPDHFLFAGSSISTGNNPPAVPYVLTVDINGSSSSIRIDGSVAASGNVGTNDLEGIAIGARADNSRFVDGDIGIIEVHNGQPSNGLTTREQQIADLFNITI